MIIEFEKYYKKRYPHGGTDKYEKFVQWEKTKQMFAERANQGSLLEAEEQLGMEFINRNV